MTAEKAEMERLRAGAGEEEFDAGMALYRRGAVTQAENPAGLLSFWVSAQERRQVVLPGHATLDGRCGCPAYAANAKPCRHVVAALLYANNAGLLAGMRQRRAREAGAQMLRALEPRIPLEQKLRLEVQLRCRRGEGETTLDIGLRVGAERLYVVRDLGHFLRELECRAPIPFGKSFVLQPEWMRFERVDEKLLGVLRELVQAAPDSAGRWLDLPQATAARVLRLFQARPFKLSLGNNNRTLERVWRCPLPIRFMVRGTGRALHINAELPAETFALTTNCEFVYSGEGVLRTPPAQREVLGLLLGYAVHGWADFGVAADEGLRVVSELLPRLARAGEVQFDAGLAHRVVRRPLAAEVYLEREGRGIVARVVFGYGELRADPFAPAQAAPNEQQDVSGLLVLRDAEAEMRVLEVLAEAGFYVRLGRACLINPEAMVRFCTQGVGVLQKIAAVYCSAEFRRLEPRRPRLGGTLRLCEGALRLELTLDGEPPEDVLAIVEALRARRRYFMLRDGAVLDLSDLEEWAALAEALQEERGETLDQGAIRLERYRAAYLVSLMGSSGLPVAVEEGVRRLADSLDGRGEGFSSPLPLADVLRNYQARGFRWLLALYRAGMGGILADDMGLGKTIQIIALLVWMQQHGEKKEPALVVAPSSLVYNWQAELEKYAPDLRSVVLEGPQAARVRLIQEARERADVVITSYPLMRRDIGILAEIGFSVAVLDEAQYIKNPASMSALAAKQLRAGARFALTGTPMENHPGELWSLFDFVLPGYLGGLARFMHRYGAGQNTDALRKTTTPFLLRRLKREVLADLPDKFEAQLLAEMTPEQRRVYTAALQRLDRRMDTLLARGSLQRERFEVLSVLTELRQICCHPALCLPDYSASSGKMDLLMDTLPSALEAGRRALVFSQFTGMLRLLQRRLEATDITCLYLDGDTPSKERLGLVRRFNGGEGQVFLISLRAGGFGLNLTGADMVVHYDPWWNPAVEDQATDRAHRIGQTKAVQVYRLITRRSVEEQVVRLSERKRTLFEAVVDGSAQGIHSGAAQIGDEELRELLRELITANQM
ncbi:MAG: DEAD/DEAH box helicase [Clostridia bacterium]|nr:DEAD/DEAH box helicase [Clostridia bacterium]